MSFPTSSRGRQRPRWLIAGFTAASLAVVSGPFAPTATAQTETPKMAVGLVSGNLLVHFDANNPGSLTRSVSISGMQPDEWMMSIEMRPGTGQLLGLAVTDTPGADRGRLYSIDATTGAATPVGTATVDVVEDGVRTTIDINPTVDRLRVVGSGHQSLRVNPNTGGLAATDSDLNPAGQSVVNVAYDQNVAASAPGATTTLFGISDSSELVRIGGVNAMPSPNLGALTTIGSLGVVADSTDVGFDIDATGAAFVSMVVDGTTGLYRVNLTTGAATLIGAIGNGRADVTDLAILSTTPKQSGQFTALASPTRALDTRQGTKVAAGRQVTVGIRNKFGVPATATAAVVNVTVTEANGGGFTTVWPSGTPRTETSSLNVESSSQTRAALVTVPLGANGGIDIFSETGSHIVVDVVGYYAPASNGAGRLNPLTPFRALDTRNGTGTGGGTAKLAPGASIDVKVAGVGGVPAANVAAVVVTLTATGTSAPGFFTAYPAGSPLPNASSLNASETNESVANLAIVPVGANGSITIFSERGSDVLVDVVGYFGADVNALAVPRGLFVPVEPARILDTRSGNGAPAAKPAAGSTTNVATRSRGGLPESGVVGIAGTVTATGSDSAGFVTSFPTGVARPNTSTLNLNRAGQTVAGPVIMAVGSDGQVSLYTEGGTHLLADVTGYYIG